MPKEANMKKPTRYDVKVDSWQERDRLGIWVTDTRTDKTIAEWWDDAAREMFEDGFFKPGVPQHSWEKPAPAFVDSVLGYLEDTGVLAKEKTGPVKGEQAGMLGVPGKVHTQKRPYEAGQMEFESYAKYREAMKEMGYKFPSESELHWATVAELKEMCNWRGLPTDGSKEDLIRRLK